MTSKGDIGATGADGSAGTLAVGTVTTGSAGGSVSVLNTGTSTAAVLNFTIPKGVAGNSGATGAIGTTGPTGAVGDNATITIGTITTGAPGSSATVANAGTDTAAQLNFTIPRGVQGAQGTFRWMGAYNASTVYATNDVVYYSGSSYVAIANAVGNTPTDTSKWEKMASAGAEGGAIGSMEDTNVSVDVDDAAILMFNDSNDKWEDKNPFGTSLSALQLDGGNF
jgi:hypothetical protein